MVLTSKVGILEGRRAASAGVTRRIEVVQYAAHMYNRYGCIGHLQYLQTPLRGADEPMSLSIWNPSRRLLSHYLAGNHIGTTPDNVSAEDKPS